jgi:hypothetical protein
MPFFSFTRDIPFASHNPSSDQPIMQTNTNSEDSIWPIDHHGFNDNLGGYHNIIHQDPQLSDPAAIPGPPQIGQTYVKTVGSDVQLYYESALGKINQLTNSSGILPRVAVNFTVTATVVTIQNSFNVTDVIRNVLGGYTINFTTPLSSQFYYPCINGQAASGSTVGVSNVSTSPVYVPTTSSITIGFQTPNSSSAFDPIFASVIIFL